MSTGPIRKLSLEKRVSRLEERLPGAWVGSTHEQQLHKPGQDAWITWAPDSALSVERSEEPVLVMVKGDHVSAHSSLLGAADAGRRVYVLAEAGWGEGKRDPGLATRKHARILVRRVPEVPVSSFHDGKHARLWLGGQDSGRTPWRMWLDETQSADFRLLFLQLFWQQARDEAWTTGNALAFHSPSDAPFDVPGLPRDAQVRLLPASEGLTLSSDQTVAIWHGAPPPAAPQTLWLLVSGQAHTTLEGLVQAGSRVVSGPLELPELALHQASGQMSLPGTQHRLHVQLNISQLAALTTILTTPPSWTYARNIRLGDHAAEQPTARFWRAGCSGPEPLEVEQVLPHGLVRALSLRAMSATQPATWKEPQPLALSARSTWEVLPPQVPQGASEDGLLGEWRSTDQQFKTRTSECRQALLSSEGHRGRLLKTFQRLLSAMTGFERSQNALDGELTQLEKAVPSHVGPQEAERLFARLQGVENQVRKLSNDMEEAERKAREDEEREKQEKAWKMGVESARHELPDARKRLEAQQAELHKLEATLPTFDPRLQALQGKLTALDEQLKALTPEPQEPKSAGAKVPTAPSQEDGPSPRLALEKEKRELLEQKGDVEVQKKRALDDKTSAQKEISRLKGKVEELTRVANEAFTFKPPVVNPGLKAGTTGGASAGASGARFVPTAPATQARATIPSEALPLVGELKHHKNQRYLVIRLWQELDSGEAEAQRLKAQLVAPEAL
ncbi:MAG: hypothetical protein ACKO6N_00225 [Myxococcota bacterium]